MSVTRDDIVLAQAEDVDSRREREVEFQLGVEEATERGVDGQVGALRVVKGLPIGEIELAQVVAGLRQVECCALVGMDFEGLRRLVVGIGLQNCNEMRGR